MALAGAARYARAVMTLRAATCTLAAIFASACARSSDASSSSSFSGGPGPDTGVAASSGSDSGSGNQDSGGSSTGTSSTSDAGSSDDSAASMPAMSTGTFDVGVQPDFDPPVGCHGKIDFLFVIESWYAMKTSQDKLQAAFKTFTDMIGQEFAEFDYHIMVVDAGGTPLLPNKCEDCYMCIGCTMPGCGDFGGPLDYPCDYGPSACDITEGAGVVVTGNFDASNKVCDLFGGNRYIIKGEPDLEGTFKCIASLGQGPKTPVAAEVMMSALQPDMLDGGCNDDFLRDDALLAVIELTGTGDGLSPGTPQSWYDKLVGAKHGNEDAVVILAFSGDLDQPEPKCEGEDTGSYPQRAFAQLAAHGLWESSCVDSYIPALTKTAEMILEQCTVFVPQ